MSLGDENVAVRRDNHIRRLVEQTWIGAGNARLAERHQQLSIRTELEDLITLTILYLRVGYPEVPLRIDRGAVRKHKHAFSPASEKLAGLVEFEDRRFRSSGTRVSRASMDHVNTAVGRSFHRRDRCPLRATRRLRPIPRRDVWIG